MKTTKTAKRAAWILEHKAEIEAARTAEIVRKGARGYNAASVDGMSCGGWGYWAWAFRAAGVDCSAMNYWSGSAPTPSTAINKGLANYVLKNAPEEIR